MIDLIVVTDAEGNRRLVCGQCGEIYKPLHRRKGSAIQWRERPVWCCGRRCSPALTDRDFREIAWRLKYG